MTRNIRSGMSVQDLKMLTAEREYRILMEQYNQQMECPCSRSDRYSPKNSRNSSPILSPIHSISNQYGYHSKELRLLMTCGGQMVSVMEGVVNIPHDI